MHTVESVKDAINNLKKLGEVMPDEENLGIITKMLNDMFPFRSSVWALKNCEHDSRLLVRRWKKQ